MSSTSDQRGHRCRSVVQKKRSRRVNVGRGRWRLSTATCCRSARTSRAVSLRLRTNTRTAARTENRNSSMTRPCFITWCRWNQPTAPDSNLLILKHDAVLATHRCPRGRLGRGNHRRDSELGSDVPVTCLTICLDSGRVLWARWGVLVTNPLREICTVGSVREECLGVAMVDLNAHEAG